MKRRKKYSYLGMLMLSLVVFASAWLTGFVRLSEEEDTQGIPLFAWQMEVSASVPEEVKVPLAEEPQQIESISGNSLSGPSLPKQEPAELKIYQADTSWFADALFIGDSRTVGLHQYGDLGGAEVIADAGMNVYKIFEKEFVLSNGEKKHLEELLSERQFGKIYVMLGINELGYDFDRTVERYAQLIQKIQEMQPDALLFLEANLHITAEKSADSLIFNNENINRFNEAVRSMADGRRSFYLDVNELFDDEDGALSTEYTVDHAHVLGKHYATWVEWILKNAVR